MMVTFCGTISLEVPDRPGSNLKVKNLKNLEYVQLKIRVLN
jgi:hypothetical protein